MGSCILIPVTKRLPGLALCGSALIGTVLLARSSNQASVADVRLETWRKAVEHHEPGQPDEAARAIAGWSKSELLGAITSIQRNPPPNSILARGAVLHLDVSILFRTVAVGPLFPSRVPDQHIAVLAADGQRRGSAPSPTHLQFGRALIEEIEPEPRRYEAARLWYRASAAFLAREHNLAEAVFHLERARALFPGDSEILLASGCLHETFASPGIQSVVRAGIGVGRHLTIGSERHNLNAAERYFRDALKSDPGNAEARLRLGRVLTVQRRHRDAMGHLQQLVDAPSDTTRTYYASIFAGREEELRGRMAEARQHFERAARLVPTAQTPHLALSRLAFHDGDVARATRSVERLFALPADEVDRYDPWWHYFSGTGRLLDMWLQRLYETVQRDAR